MRREDFLKRRWCEKGGCPLVKESPRDLRSLQHSERDEEFERLCMNRKVLGSMRYALMHDPAAANWDGIKSAKERLERFEEDGNLEHLVDVANLCEIKFVRLRARGYKVTPIDDSDLHVVLKGQN